MAEAASTTPATAAACGALSGWLTPYLRLPDRTRMSRLKPFAFTGTAELNAMIERVAPDVLGLLADGVPRTKGAVVAALARRHEGEDVALTLVRLTVTGRVEETGGKYALEIAEP